MKSQIMKKEEEVENLEEEVVTLRSKIVKLNKNVEEKKTSTSVIENEDKHSRLLEKKNEENRNSYAEVLKGRNHGQPESKKTVEDTSSRRPSMFKPKIRFNHDHDQSRQKFIRTTPKRRSFTPRYANFFDGHFFIVLILDIRLQIAGIIKEMFKKEMPMWPHITLNAKNFITMETYLVIVET
jgi:hypothetical protein